MSQNTEKQNLLIETWWGKLLHRLNLKPSLRSGPKFIENIYKIPPTGREGGRGGREGEREEGRRERNFTKCAVSRTMKGKCDNLNLLHCIL